MSRVEREKITKLKARFHEFLNSRNWDIDYPDQQEFQFIRSCYKKVRYENKDVLTRDEKQHLNRLWKRYGKN